jgi:hypothetical protein
MKKLTILVCAALFSFITLTASATTCKEDCMGTKNHKACLEKCSDTSVKFKNN